ncbi:hypothetical protein [Streptomyces mayteni]
MVNQERYARYAAEATVLAAIGERLDTQLGRVVVRLPRALAEAAAAAWERDDPPEPGEPAPETHEQYAVRGEAAELALIGLAIVDRGRWEGDEVVVDLDIESAGAAIRASQ